MSLTRIAQSGITEPAPPAWTPHIHRSANPSPTERQCSIRVFRRQIWNWNCANGPRLAMQPARNPIPEATSWSRYSCRGNQNGLPLVCRARASPCRPKEKQLSSHPLGILARDQVMSLTGHPRTGVLVMNRRHKSLQTANWYDAIKCPFRPCLWPGRPLLMARLERKDVPFQP